MKELTNREIKKMAASRLKENIVSAILTSLYLCSVLILIILTETFIFIGLTLLGINYHIFSLEYYLTSPGAVLFLAVRLVCYYILYNTQAYIARRSLIGFSQNDKALERYLAGHLRLVMFPSLKCSMQLAGLKLLVLLPAIAGAYGIYHFAQVSSSGKITMPGLFGFMLSIGFTLVWIGVCMHYFLSLALVKYILILNPRSDFFDACDLSVKLMEGKHYRVTMLYLSFVIFIPAMLFIYPCLIIFPYFMDCRLILAKEIMGSYWQDKLPAMAKRWEKQQERKLRSREAERG